jgi:hypothetical protein
MLGSTAQYYYYYYHSNYSSFHSLLLLLLLLLDVFVSTMLSPTMFSAMNVACARHGVAYSPMRARVLSRNRITPLLRYSTQCRCLFLKYSSGSPRTMHRGKEMSGT